MWHRLILGVGLGLGLAGCGFQSTAAAGGSDGGPGDAIDGGGAGDGSSGATDCLAHWRNGPPTITAVDELGLAVTDTEDRDPWISPTGLRLYFSREPSVHGMTDIYLASRGSTADPFSGATEPGNLGTADHEDRPALTMNEDTLVLSSDHGTPAGKFQIFITTRPDMTKDFGPLDQDHLGNVNDGGADQQDPFLSPDGQTLYLAPDPNGPTPPSIVFSTRDAKGDFMTPTTLINSGSGDAAPALTPDELILVFSSLRPGGSGLGDLWYATRPSKTVGFGPAALIPAVNSTADDADPMLSADGCELYFSSNRGSDGKHHLFRAQIAR